MVISTELMLDKVELEVEDGLMEDEVVLEVKSEELAVDEIELEDEEGLIVDDFDTDDELIDGAVELEALELVAEEDVLVDVEVDTTDEGLVSAVISE